MTIDLNLSAEQVQITTALRDLLAHNHPLSRLHEGATELRQDRAAIEEVAGFGGFSLSLPEDAGGVGLSVVEDVLVHVELGRALVGPGALAAAVAARAVRHGGLAGDIEGIASGATRVCLANALTPFSLDAVAGLPVHVWDWEGCALAVLWNDAGVVLLDPRRLQIAPRRGTDRTVTVGRANVAADAVMATVPASAAALPRVAQLLVAAQLLGMAQATRDMAVEYAKLRRQFGEPIGAFQAVKHRCADMAVNAEVLEAQLVFAAIAERDGWQDAAFQGAACRQLAARNALDNARSNIQVHGGIGFSAESDAHLHLVRAHLLQNLGGPVHLAEQQFLDCSAPTFASGRPAAV